MWRQQGDCRHHMSRTLSKSQPAHLAGADFGPAQSKALQPGAEGQMSGLAAVETQLDPDRALQPFPVLQDILQQQPTTGVILI